MLSSLLRLWIVLLVILPVYVSGGDLKSQLWRAVDGCYALTQEVEMPDTSIVEDVANGYLKVSGIIGTCGCACDVSVAAFRSAGQDYTLLKKESYGCSSSYKLSSNKSLSTIFPIKLGINTFIDSGDYAANFYVDIEPPQRGRTVLATLKLKPLGVFYTENSPFQFDEQQGKRQSLGFLRAIAYGVKDTETLTHLRLSNDTQITKADEKTIRQLFQQYGKQWTGKRLSTELQRLYEFYQAYESRQFDAVRLQWHKKKERFVIDKYIKKKQSISFKQFLLQQTYWAALC